VRRFRPRRIVEVGSGNSTRLALLAAAANGTPCEVVAVDPEPRAELDGAVRWVRSRVEDAPLETFAALAENDVLFVDSSHVLRLGGDVQHLFLEVIPRLAPGVLVHVHDVFLPAEYPAVAGGQWFMNEQHVLQAFLAFNDAFEVVLAGSYLHLEHPDLLCECFSAYARAGDRWPVTSFWLRRTR
jgi:fermentation-respiration switch protein FrsA (DUF1100 family)